MKFKKIISAVVSAAMCFSMFALNASANETETGLTPVAGQTQTEKIELDELISNGYSFTNEYNSYDIADISQIDTNNNHEATNISENEILTTSDSEIVPYASAIPLSYVRIAGVWLGNAASDPFSDFDLNNSVTKWKEIYRDDNAPKNEINCSIDSTGYSYIRVRILTWGQTTSGYVKLDDDGYTSSVGVRDLNALGRPISAGEIYYGGYDDYIFKIPDEKDTSIVSFLFYYKYSIPSVERRAQVNITWTTPTKPAPTTPEINYIVNPNYEGYAAVSGLDTTMEYRAKYDRENGSAYSSWTTVSNSTMYFPIQTENYTIQVRYKTSSNGRPSLNCEIPVKMRSEGPIDYIAYYDVFEILAIYESEKDIEIAPGDGTWFFKVPAVDIEIGSFIDDIPAGSSNNIYIRYAATSDEPASQALALTLYGRNPNTPENVYYENRMLHNLTQDMVFRFNGGNWYTTTYSDVNVTAFLSESDTTLFEIKYLPTETMSCSNTIQIILPALS